MFSQAYWINLLLSLPGIITAITFHEMAHGIAAEQMGDDTAKRMGRLSLNPFKHLDPIGFLSMLIFHFGWAKPVPINPSNFRDQRKGIIWVSLAGSLTNLILGFISVAALYAVMPLNNMYLNIVIQDMAVYNIMFAVFNLIPIPPLDGSQILAEFLPYQARQKYQSIARYGMWILLAMMWLGLFSMIISPIVSWIYGLFAKILLPLFMAIYK